MRPLILALAVLAVLPGTADAICSSSTPSTASFADPPADGELGLAPEIVSVMATTDAACRMTVQDVLADAAAPGDLIDGEAVGLYLDTDGNAATGSPLWDGADRVAIIVGMAGPDLGPGLGVWDGATFSFAGTPPLAPVGAAGFSATPDQLGMAAPAAVGIRTAALWSGVYDTYADFAPEPFAPPFRFPVTFSTAAPSPSPTVPPVTTQPVATPLVATPTGCTVPRVKRQRSTSAGRRLRRAGCRYRVVRVRSGVAAGLVVSTRPAAGRRTSRTVLVRVSRGRARRAVLARVPETALGAVERDLSRHVLRRSGD
jgi:hypothetical protein